MAITASRPTVGTSATLIATNSSSGTNPDTASLSVGIKNVTATGPVFLGGDNTVTASNGFQWDVADGPLSVDLEPGESLYGIVSVTAQVLHVLRSGR